MRRMERGDIDRWIGRRAARGKDLGGASEPLLPPLTDLGGMQLEALAELRQGGIASQCREGDLGLEGGGVIPTGTTGDEGSNEMSERSVGKPARLHSALFRLPEPLLSRSR